MISMMSVRRGRILQKGADHPGRGQNPFLHTYILNHKHEHTKAEVYTHRHTNIYKETCEACNECFSEQGHGQTRQVTAHLTHPVGKETSLLQYTT